MKSDEFSFGQSSWAFTDTSSFDVVSLLDEPDDFSRTEFEVQALIDEGKALLNRAPNIWKTTTATMVTSPPNPSEDDDVAGATSGVVVRQIQEESLGQVRNANGINRDEESELQRPASGAAIMSVGDKKSERGDPLQKLACSTRASETFEAGNIPNYVEMTQRKSDNNDSWPTEDETVIESSKPKKLPSTATARPDTMTESTTSVTTSGDLRCINHANCRDLFCGLHRPITDSNFLEPTIVQCQGILQGGIRCINVAKKGLLFCGLHIPSENTNMLPPLPPAAAPPSQNNCCAAMQCGRCCATTTQGPPYAIGAPFYVLDQRPKCPATSTRGNRCGQDVASGQTYCGRHNQHPQTKTIGSQQCVHVSSRGKRCKDTAKKGQRHCGRHAAVLVPMVRIPATKTIAMCSGFTDGRPCPNMSKQGSYVCRQHEIVSPLVPAPPIPGQRSNRCISTTKTGKRCVDSVINGSSHCFNHAKGLVNPVNLSRPSPPQMQGQDTSNCCISSTKKGKRCVDPVVKGSLYCFNHHKGLVNQGACLVSSKSKKICQCQGIMAETGKRCKDTAKKGRAFCAKHNTSNVSTNNARNNDDTHQQVVMSKGDLQALIHAVIANSTA